MEKIVYRVSLDVNKNGIQKTIQGIETGDRIAREVRITLRNGKENYELPSDNTVVAYMKVTKPTGEGADAQACTIDRNGEIVYLIQPTDTEVMGTTIMQLELVGSTKTGATAVIVAPRFAVEVWESEYVDSSATSTNTFSALVDALAEARAYYNKRFKQIVIDDDNTLHVIFEDGTDYTNDSLNKITDKIIYLDKAVAKIADDLYATTITEDRIREINEAADEKMAEVDKDADEKVAEVIAITTQKVNEIQTKGQETIDSIPSDYTTLANNVTELRGDLTKTEESITEISKYNCIDIINQYKVVDATKSGITATVNDDGSVHLQGTSTAQVFFNYFYDLSKLANGVINGETYTLIHTSEKVRVEIWFYKNGTYLKGSSYRQNVNITIPNDANGMLIRLRVDNELTVDETVRPIMLNTFSNQELSEKIGLIESDKTYLKYKGSLANDFNIDEDFDTGIYLLTGNTSAPTGLGNLLNIRNSNTIRTQIMYRFTDINIYYRRYASGEWSDWQSIKYAFGELYPLRQKKYLAFGDSLTWGALWNDTTPTITRASEGSRIPDRIANAVNCKEYINYGVGGMGYVATSSTNPTTIIDEIKSHDITNASLITVMAGRNDGAIQLGTKNSTSGDGTICGAIKEIIDYAKSQNKMCQLVFIQVTPYTSANKPWTATSTSGWTLNSFDAEVSELCKEANVGYVNWYGCSLFNSWSDLSGGGGNYAHMRTDEGYEQMGNFIAGQVSKFYQN